MSHWCQAEGEDHLHRPAGKALPVAAQEASGLCCKGPLLGLGQLVLHQDLQGVLCKAAFQPAGLLLARAGWPSHQLPLWESSLHSPLSRGAAGLSLGAAGVRASETAGLREDPATLSLVTWMLHRLLASSLCEGVWVAAASLS